MQSTHQS